MAFSKQYLDFEPTEIPGWRKRLPENADESTISDMVKEIVKYRGQLLRVKIKKRLNKKATTDIDMDFLIQFLLNIQTDEGIGLQNEGSTKEVISKIVEDWPEYDFDRIISDLVPYEYEPMAFEKQSSSQESIGSDHSQNSVLSSDDEGSKRLKLDDTVADYDLPNYPSDGTTEAVIKRAHEIKSRDSFLRKQVHETINLYRGYKRLAKEIDKVDKKDKFIGLIDVDVLVLGVHKILMDNVMDDAKTKPGQFSINERSATFKGVFHTYPRFATEEIARTAIQTLVDKYTDILEEIRKIPDELQNEERKIKHYFKLASLFLFGFLTLHPFGDGNGRLARLLCSYSLLRLSPFLTPIFNVFSPSEEGDYVDALVAARQGLKLPELIATEQEAKAAAIKVLSQKPSDLCSLLIESNNYMFKEYLQRINNLRSNHEN